MSRKARFLPFRQTGASGGRKIISGIVIALGVLTAMPALAQTTTVNGAETFQAPITGEAPIFKTTAGGNMMYARPGTFFGTSFMGERGMGYSGGWFFLCGFAMVITVLLVWTLLVLTIIILLKKIKNRE